VVADASALLGVRVAVDATGVAVSIGVGVLRRPEHLVRQVVIPQLHAEMWANVSDSTRFRQRVTESR